MTGTVETIGSNFNKKNNSVKKNSEEVSYKK